MNFCKNISHRNLLITALLKKFGCYLDQFSFSFFRIFYISLCHKLTTY